MTMKWKSWVVAGLGVWLIFAAFTAMGVQAQRWDGAIVGVALVALGLWLAGGRPTNGWIACLIGVWLILSAFVPTLWSGSGLYSNNFVMGLVVVLAGLGAARVEDTT
jgi:hypothetical protein